MSLRDLLARADFEASKTFHSDPAYHVEWDQLDERVRHNYLMRQNRALIVVERWLQDQHVEAISVFYDDLFGHGEPEPWRE